MAFILPFRGLRYNTARAGLMTELVAPPYDVVDIRKRDRLISRNRYNIFSLELPEKKICRGTAEDKYTCARTLFRDWISKSVLIKNSLPAVYPYDINFSTPEGIFCRRGFIALIRIEDWKKGIIRPHERTFNKVTEDRLRLMETTEAQFSQIFLLYRHNKDAARILLSSPRKELYTIEDESGNTHSLWQITHVPSLVSLRRTLADSILYIADGHHRYTTALNYRNKMRELYGDDPSMPYNYLMAYLVDAEDPGLIVLPCHRIITMPHQPDPGSIEKDASQLFEIESIAAGTGINSLGLAGEITKRLEGSPSRRGLGVVFGRNRRAAIWWLKHATDQDVSRNHMHPALTSLDVVMLEEKVMKDALHIDSHGLEVGKTIQYVVEADSAIERLGEQDILFILRSTPVSQVLDVSDAGQTMPHKSTFFYPKILTGLIMNTISRNEPLDLLEETEHSPGTAKVS
ncbi:MAG TPA: DUF1015 domain-containing protein [Thermodesulfobacteriaceae bacterium]|nr:DUF1015 domain-containing protein [Thermodesulfobacteriaceae bacterium]